jgi:glyoxylase-like metal-dependent hydrolase (beta-lactamase superfamily II)
MRAVCSTCGSQFAESDTPPDRCPICDEVRQYVLPTGQRWTTVEALRRTHRNCFQRLESHLLGIGMAPDFAITQRALLVESDEGNVLWDCVSLIDQATVDLLSGLGGVAAIAISHPHYYTSMVEWSHAFGRVPIYLHERDRIWVQRPDPVIEFWSGRTRPLWRGLTLVHCGGHFAGGTVLHWAAGADGRGALLTGDILQVTADRKFVSFLRSYPNMIPLSRAAVESVVAALDPYPYDRIYGAFWDRHVESDAQAAVARSLERYVAAIEGGDPDDCRDDSDRLDARRGAI